MTDERVQLLGEGFKWEKGASREDVASLYADGKRIETELQDTKRALDLATEHLMMEDMIYLDGERIDNPDYWMEQARKERLAKQ